MFRLRLFPIASLVLGLCILVGISEDGQARTGAEGDGLSIGDFNIPEAVGLPAPVAGVERANEESLGAPVMHGGTAQDAADAAVLELVEQEEGIRLIETGSGLGVVSCASAYYATESLSADIVLRGQRLAFVKAGLGAKAGLVEYMQGLSLEGQTRIASSFRTEDTDESSLVEMASSAEERIQTLTEGFLRGAVIYSVNDYPIEGRVIVSVVSTPKTQRALRAGSSRLISVADFSAGEKLLKAEIMRGVIPPDGARIITVPGTGETAWIGFGAELISSTSSNSRLQGMARKSATTVAKRRAQQNLLRAITGESIRREDLVDSSFADSIRVSDDLLGGAHEEEASAFASTASAELMESKNNGHVPAGAIPTTFTSADGRWMYAICTHRESRPDARIPTQRDGLGAKVVAASPEAASPASAPPARRSAQDSEPTSPHACETPTEEGYRRVLAVGEGSNRKLALKAALLEGVERANGFVLNASTAVKQQYMDAIVDLNGQLDSIIMSESSVEEEIYTKANGMVKTYEVISESVSSASGLIRLEVCVVIPVFDPSRSRPGRRPTIAVLSLGTSAATFNVTGSNIPSRDVADEVASDIVSGLVMLGGFTVLDRQHLDDLQGELAYLKSGLADGSMEQAESIKLGHILGADYIVVGDFHHLEHLMWNEYIPIRDAQEARESLGVKSSCRLVNVATGAIVTSDEYESSWGLMDLHPDRLKPYELGLSRQTLGCRRAVDSHLLALVDAMQKLKRGEHPRFIAAMGHSKAVLKYAGPTYKVGDVLVVRGILRIELEGEVEEIESEKGIVKITRVDLSKGHLYVDVIEGDVDSFVKGDVCRR